MMIAELNAKVVEQGKIPLTPIGTSYMSVCNYTVAIICEGGLSIDSNKAILKTNTRFTAENSFTAVMNFTIVVAHSHFIPVSVPCKNVERDIEKADIGVMILVEMVSQAWGTPVIPINPQYVFLSDDTVVYIYKGKANKQGTFYLVSTKSLKAVGNQSKYSIDESCIMNGM